MKEKLFNIGDRVYSTKSLNDIQYEYRKAMRLQNHSCSHPMEKRIKQIEADKDGEFHYGVGDFHFTNEDVGKFIFTDFDSAMNAINN